MSRRLASGTPTRSEGYIYPDSKRRVWLWSISGGAGLVFVLVGLYFVGAESTLSPGPVVAAHAPIEGDCALCHVVGSAIDDVRCERCHDYAGTAKLTNQAHVLYGSGDVRKANRAESVACITCHVDHRGREYALRETDPRECGTCHQFSTLRRHPEFAVVTADAQTGLGLKFPHDRHITDVERVLGTGCAACHVPTVDLVGFEPIDFDRHCAFCHAADGFITGKTGKMSEALLALGDDVPEEWRQESLVVETGGRPSRRLAEASNLVHRDPWVRYNGLKLSREIAPEEERAEIAVLQAQLAWLEQQRRENPLRSLTSTQLGSLEASLTAQLREVEEKLVVVAAQTDQTAALQGISESAHILAAELDDAGLAAAVAGTPGGSFANDLQGVEERLGAGDEPEPEPEAVALDRIERRKEELLRLIDAIVARGDDTIRSRAADVRSAVESIVAEPADGSADSAALRLQLDTLDDVLRAVDTIGDPQGQIGASQVASLRNLASQRIGGGLAPIEFADRRRELLDLLDAVERRSGDALALPLAQLRTSALSLRIGDSGDADLQQRAAGTRRLLGRVRLERELLSRRPSNDPAGQARRRPLALGSQRDLAAIDDLAAEIRGRLEELRRGPRGSVAVGVEERALREATLGALYNACTKCHELQRTRIAPVRVAEPVMANAVFSHAPHVTQVDCSACHGDPASEDAAVRRVHDSKSAVDVNVPGVVECAVCHNPSDVSDDCETCHRYHPPTINALMRMQ